MSPSEEMELELNTIVSNAISMDLPDQRQREQGFGTNLRNVLSSIEGSPANPLYQFNRYFNLFRSLDGLLSQIDSGEVTLNPETLDYIHFVQDETIKRVTQLKDHAEDYLLRDFFYGRDFSGSIDRLYIHIDRIIALKSSQLWHPFHAGVGFLQKVGAKGKTVCAYQPDKAREAYGFVINSSSQMLNTILDSIKTRSEEVDFNSNISMLYMLIEKGYDSIIGSYLARRVGPAFGDFEDEHHSMKHAQSRKETNVATWRRKIYDAGAKIIE